MVNMAACYWGGPGLKSWQGRIWAPTCQGAGVKSSTWNAAHRGPLRIIKCNVYNRFVLRVNDSQTKVILNLGTKKIPTKYYTSKIRKTIKKASIIPMFQAARPQFHMFKLTTCYTLTIWATIALKENIAITKW